MLRADWGEMGAGTCSLTEQGGTGMGSGDDEGVTANSSSVSMSIWVCGARTVGIDTLSMVGN